MSNAKPVEKLDSSAIAIIGMACRFPGAKNIDEFWRNLRDGVESISFLTGDELEPSGIDPAALNNPNYVKAASILEDVDLFDASFFGFTPREAEIMDPQHRLFLECAWVALEHAGYDAETYKGSIGVFSGARTNTYLFNLYSDPAVVQSLGAFQIGLGNDLAFLTTRVSYKLNLKGPSCSVHTACSTSLVAVHLACQSLLTDECQIALAGGIAINVPQKTGYLYQPGGIVSPDGHCRAFDAKAQGTIFGSGVGIVVLKRLEDALADGDSIHAVIKASAVNNDGSVKASFTAPSVNSQTEVIKDATANAEIEAESISYVEAHGTGTPLGDAIEIRALTKAFRASTDKRGFCAIGSVKTNFGHLDAAAGIAGLIKVVLALQQKRLPPSLHFEQANPDIDFESSPFFVNTTLCEWKADRTPRRAGVSSFGVGGTNAHIILEEAPPREKSGDSRPWQVLALSAKSRAALETATANLLDHLKQHSDVNIADVAYTLGVGRGAFIHRRMLVCRSLEEAVSALETMDPQRVFSDSHQTGDPPVVFMFPGQGAQYVNMGLELYQTEPAFREPVDHCAERLRPHLNLDLRTVLYPSDDQVEAALHQINQTWITQPALFVIEYALAKLWMQWGVHPQGMIGHSIGEYVAACLAGVCSLEDALALVASRGRMMQQLPSGAMLAVPLTEKEVRSLINGQLSLAAINEPSMCVASGATAAIDELEQLLADKGLAYRRLPTSHAFHSEMVNPIIEPFTEQVKRVSPKRLQIPYISNVTGTWMRAEDAVNAKYWGRHLRQTVRFAEGLEELLKEPERILLEVGPGRALSRLAKRHPSCTPERIVLASMRHRDDQQSDVELLLATLGKLWLAGVPVDWSGVYAHEQRHRLSLPTYPFERQRYWIALQNQTNENRAGQVSLGKKPEIADWFYIPSWRRTMPPRSFSLSNPAKDPGCWVVFVDQSGFGSALIKRLQQEHQDVVSVLAGEKFDQVQDGVYSIDPASSEDYRTLLEELRGLSHPPSLFIHLWSITPNDEMASGLDFFEKAQERGLYSLLYLARAIRQENLADPVQLWVVSNNVQSVESQDVSRPEKATMLAACKVIPQEHKNISCHSIDVVLAESGSQREETLIEQIMAEVGGRTSDVVIAYRGHQRLVQSFEPVRLDAEAGPNRSLRENGVYLITGGVGGVGLLVAEHLARTVRAKLILTGRSAFPNKDDWGEWLATHDDHDSVSQKIRKVQALEELGAEVFMSSVDVSDEDQMQALVTQIYTQFGQLNGVLHAAGITSGPSLYRPSTEMGPDEAQLQFQPKVYGVYVLDKVLQGRELDFCLLFSSNASVLGGMGLVAYSAANHFMDAFAVSRSHISQVPWISANWDPWPEETKKYGGVKTSVDQYTMTPQESVEAFNRVVSLATAGQVVVSTGDLPARLNLWIRSESATSKRDGTSAGSDTSAHPRPSIQNVYVAPRNETELLIADVWQQVLGIKQVGIDDNFFDLGGHSLLMIQVQGKLRDALNQEISMIDMFKYPTVGSLAEYLSQVTMSPPSFEPIHDRARKRAEALNRQKQMKGKRHIYEDAPAVADLPPTLAGVQREQENQEKMSLLEMLAELSEAEPELEIEPAPPSARRFVMDEEINNFAGRLISRLRHQVESILYYPHPFTRGGFVVVIDDERESILDCLAEMYMDAPPDVVVYCLRRRELVELTYPGLFYPPDVNGKSHLIPWLKRKGVVLYGPDIRDRIRGPATDPKLLLEGHIMACAHACMRGDTILTNLLKRRYHVLVRELDRQMRYLMATALLVHNESDVEMETLPERFQRSYPDRQMGQVYEEFRRLLQHMEAKDESECRQSACEAVWLFESFLRHLRRYVR